MAYLPSLARKIEAFCKLAESFGLVAYAAPEDEAIHNSLLSAANVLSTQAGRTDVAQQIKMLAAMFAKATEMGMGFNTIYLTSRGMLEDLDVELDEDDPGKNESTDALNTLMSSVRKRGANPDSVSVQRELQKAAGDALRKMEEEGEEIQRPEDTQENLLEMGQSSEAAGIRGGGDPARKASPEEDAEANEVVQLFEEEAGSKMDPTAGLGVEERQKGPGAGVQLFQKRPLKDWAQTYTREKERYEEDLNSPANLISPAAASARKQSRVRYYLFTLVKTLDRLIELSIRAAQLEHTMQVETEIEHPKEKAEHDKIMQHLRGLEALRSSLKRGITALYREARLRDLKETFDTSDDPRLKVMLARKIERTQKSLAKINKDKDTFEQTKDALAKKRTATQASRMGYELGEDSEKRRDKHYRQYEWNKMSLDGLLVQLGHSIADKRQTVKKKLIPLLENFGVQEAKNYVDDIATAAVKTQNIGGAVHRLSQEVRSVIKSKMDQQKQVLFPKQAVMAFLFYTRIIKDIVEWRDSVANLEKYLSGKSKSINEKAKPLRSQQKKTETVEPVPVGQVPLDALWVMQQTATKGRALVEKYSSYQARIPVWFFGGSESDPGKAGEMAKMRVPVFFGKDPIDLRETSKTIADRINFICNYLEGRVQEEKKIQGIAEEPNV